MSLEKLSENVYTWFRYSDRLGYDLNGHYLSSGDGNVLVDPPELTDDEADEIESLGEPQLILVTNHTHWRSTAAHLERWGLPVAAHPADAGRLPRVDRFLRDGEGLPGGWRVVATPGKTLGEVALHLGRERGVLLVGDLLIGQPEGRVRLLPDDKLEDRGLTMESLRRIAALEFDALLVGDGTSILHGARSVVCEFVAGVAPSPSAGGAAPNAADPGGAGRVAAGPGGAAVPPVDPGSRPGPVS